MSRVASQPCRGQQTPGDGLHALVAGMARHSAMLELIKRHHLVHLAEVAQLYERRAFSLCGGAHCLVLGGVLPEHVRHDDPSAVFRVEKAYHTAVVLRKVVLIQRFRRGVGAQYHAEYVVRPPVAQVCKVAQHLPVRPERALPIGQLAYAP